MVGLQRTYIKYVPTVMNGICDENICDENICDENICDENICDENICDEGGTER